MTRAKTKITPRPRATKAAAPLTEAEHRILKAVDLTRMLAEHRDAKQIGLRNRDRGFAILLVHLNAAYKALYRYSNRDA